MKQAKDTILAEIDQTHFGASLLSLLSLHMTANTPYDEVLRLIESVKVILENE